MARENYKKMIKQNSGFNRIACIPLTEKQSIGLKRYCKVHSIPSGNDDKTHFLIHAGILNYKVSIIRTTSGKFAKIKCNYSF